MNVTGLQTQTSARPRSLVRRLRCVDVVEYRDGTRACVSTDEGPLP